MPFFKTKGGSVYALSKFFNFSIFLYFTASIVFEIIRHTMATAVGDMAKHIFSIFSGVIFIYSIVELIRVKIKLKKMEDDDFDFDF